MPVRLLDLTPPDMHRLMERLAVNFGGKKDLAAKSDLWYDKLQHYPLAIVERVVDRLLSSESRYFPQVGAALAIAKELAPDAVRDHGGQRERMRAWEKDPWASIATLDGDELACTSVPCPVCGESISFSSRGAVIRHDPGAHAAAQVSYSDIGRPEWLKMPPPFLPEPKKVLPRTPNPYATLKEPTPLAEAVKEAVSQ